jgi:hypothetical protein
MVPTANRLCLVMFLLTLCLLPPSVAAAAAQAATPDPGTPPAGVTIDHLIASTLDRQDLRTGFNALLLERIILAPGATATVGVGAHLFVVEAGALTVAGQVQPRAEPAVAPCTAAPPPPGGSATPGQATGAPVEATPAPSVTHGAGEQFLVVADNASSPAITNEGAGPAAALVVSIAATGCNPTNQTVSGEADVVVLVDTGVARVGQPLVTAGREGAEPIAVALDRVRYDRGARLDLTDPAARLLVGESGAVNVRVADPASYFRAASPGLLQPLPATARVSLVADDYVLLPAPGRVSTRNVARGPSEVLILTIATASAAPDAD